MSDSTNGGAVRSRRDGDVTILTLDYPARRNALSLPLRAALFEELTSAMEDNSCRAIVMCGEGGDFCSGGDLSSMEGVDALAGRARMNQIHRVVRLLITGPKPVVAAVEGHAAGAGLSLAAACDIVVASATARFACTFNRIGLLPDLGAIWTLSQRMGLGRAKMLMMGGRVLDGGTAERQGLVDLLTPAGTALEHATELANELATFAPNSNAFIKAALGNGPGTLHQVLAAEADAQGLLYGSQDFKEGRSAFFERRPPRFTGN